MPHWHVPLSSCQWGLTLPPSWSSICLLDFSRPVLLLFNEVWAELVGSVWRRIVRQIEVGGGAGKGNLFILMKTHNARCTFRKWENYLWGCFFVFFPLIFANGFKEIHWICKLILVDRAFFQPVTAQVLVSVGLTCQLKRHIKKAPQANWWGISMCKGTGADAAASLRKSTCTHCPAHEMYLATKYFCNHCMSNTLAAKHLLGPGCGFAVLYFFHFWGV